MKGHQFVIVSFPQLRMTDKWQFLAVYGDMFPTGCCCKLSIIRSVFAQGGMWCGHNDWAKSSFPHAQTAVAVSQDQNLLQVVNWSFPGVSNIIASVSAPSESHKKSSNSRRAELNIVIQIKAAALKRCHSHLDAKSGSAAPAVFPFQCTGGLLFFCCFFFNILSHKISKESNGKKKKKNLGSQRAYF